MGSYNKPKLDFIKFKDVTDWLIAGTSINEVVSLFREYENKEIPVKCVFNDIEVNSKMAEDDIYIEITGLDKEDYLSLCNYEKQELKKEDNLKYDDILHMEIKWLKKKINYYKNKLKEVK